VARASSRRTLEMIVRPKSQAGGDLIIVNTKPTKTSVRNLVDARKRQTQEEIRCEIDLVLRHGSSVVFI
jgi:ABC-type molybdate transport system ATPase subunit